MTTKANRRKFISAFGSIFLTTSIAGCSENQKKSENSSNSSNGTVAPTENTSSTDSTTNESTETSTENTDSLEPETPRGEAEDTMNGNTIETLENYRFVAQNPDDWVGSEIQVNNVNYSGTNNNYRRFRAFYESENVGRPFYIKVTDTFESNEEISFTGTVEKIETIQDVNVIFVENVSIQ